MAAKPAAFALIRPMKFLDGLYYFWQTATATSYAPLSQIEEFLLNNRVNVQLQTLLDDIGLGLHTLQDKDNSAPGLSHFLSVLKRSEPDQFRVLQPTEVGLNTYQLQVLTADEMALLLLAAGFQYVLRNNWSTYVAETLCKTKKFEDVWAKYRQQQEQQQQQPTTSPWGALRSREYKEEEEYAHLASRSSRPFIQQQPLARHKEYSSLMQQRHADPEQRLTAFYIASADSIIISSTSGTEVKKQQLPANPNGWIFVAPSIISEAGILIPVQDLYLARTALPNSRPVFPIFQLPRECPTQGSKSATIWTRIVSQCPFLKGRRFDVAVQPTLEGPTKMRVVQLIQTQAEDAFETLFAQSPAEAELMAARIAIQEKHVSSPREKRVSTLSGFHPLDSSSSFDNIFQSLVDLEAITKERVEIRG